MEIKKDIEIDCWVNRWRDRWRERWLGGIDGLMYRYPWREMDIEIGRQIES